MATSTSYHVGGYLPAAPQQNRRELFDGGAGLYTSWDTAGVQTGQRPLTTAEAAQLAAQDTAAATAAAVQSRGDTIRAVAQTLATLRSQSVTLSTTSSASWALAEKKALGAGLVQLIDAIVQIGKQSLNED